MLIAFDIQVAFGATAGTTHDLLLVYFEALDLQTVVGHDAQAGVLTLRAASHF
ncbi:hypothetical protein D3C87_1864420 [compost metagenome]